VKKTVRDIEVKGKRALVRCDFNVPQDEQGRITDERRIEESLPTIRYLMQQGAKVILMSHLGRPKGKRDPNYSLAPVAEALGRLLGTKVALLPDCVGPKVESAVSNMKDGEAVLLENVRFYPEEEENDEGFARKLARLGDFYVSDAFATAHRANASTEAVARLLKPAVSGFLMEKELTVMGKALESPERPVVALLGGAKVSDKIPLIENLMKKVGVLLIGGGMAYTFLKAKGMEVGKSLLEQEHVDRAKAMMANAGKSGVKLMLPVDVVAAAGLKEGVETKVVAADQIPADMMGADIGPKTVEMWSEIIRQAKTVLWNGPMGVFEYSPFAEGTRRMAAALASSGATTIVGGGETAEAVEQMGFAGKMTYVSTGGGASVEFWAGDVLPGVAVLEDK
jgi:phosphoglycerate kinase